MPNDLHSRIRAAVAYSGLSRDAIAKHLEISPTTLWRTMEGKRTPKRPELVALADLADVPLDWLSNGFPDEVAGDRRARVARLADQLKDVPGD